MKDKPRRWPDYLPQVCDAINYGYNLTLKERPAYLFFGHEPEPLLDFNDTCPVNQGGEEVDKNEEYMKLKYAMELVERELEKSHMTLDKKK